MRLKTFDKVMLILLLIVNVALFGFLIFISIVPGAFTNALMVLYNLSQNILFKVLLIAISALLLFVIGRILFVREKSKDAVEDFEKNARSKASTNIKIATNAGGSSYIALPVVREVVEGIANENAGVFSSAAHISQSGEDNSQLEIMIDIAAKADQKLPQLSDELQNDVKTRVEERLGASVSGVSINFTSTNAGSGQSTQSDSTGSRVI